ncbi:MAG: hypothetical protein AVDCRST_MAG24-1146, partial [uncultured Nocardioidaceae bacterium]
PRGGSLTGRLCAVRDREPHRGGHSPASGPAGFGPGAPDVV